MCWFRFGDGSAVASCETRLPGAVAHDRARPECVGGVHPSGGFDALELEYGTGSRRGVTGGCVTSMAGEGAPMAGEGAPGGTLYCTIRSASLFLKASVALLSC